MKVENCNGNEIISDFLSKKRQSQIDFDLMKWMRGESLLFPSIPIPFTSNLSKKHKNVLPIEMGVFYRFGNLLWGI